MAPQASLLSLPRELRDLILQYAIPYREVTFGHTPIKKEPARRFHGFGWDVLAPRSLQGDARVAISHLEPFDAYRRRPTLLAPSASEMQSSSKSSSINVLLTCQRLHAEAAEILYSGECTRFRFWSIYALTSFLHCVGDNASFLREVYLRIELSWISQPDVRQCREDMQYLLFQAAQRLTLLRCLELLISLDPLECLPDYWSERNPADSDAFIGLQEMFSPLRQIETLNEVRVKIQSRNPFSTPGTKAEFSRVREELEDGLSTYLHPGNPLQEPVETLEDDKWQEQYHLEPTGSTQADAISDKGNAPWICCAQ